MNEVGNSPKPLAQQGKDLADTATSKMQSGIRSTEHAANKAIDKTAGKVDEVKSNVAPQMDKIGDQAQELMQKGREVFNEASKVVRERAVQASDMAVGYAKDEPLKAMLMAAAAGALLMGLVTLMARSRD